MKNKLWFYQLPFILLATLAFYVTDAGLRAELENPFLRTKVYPSLQRAATFFTDLKFRLRGPQAPKNNVVIVEIDSSAVSDPDPQDPSVGGFGRWPWHRDMTAKLINRVFEYGAKAVGLDMVFSETDQRIPNEFRQYLTSVGQSSAIENFETDHELEKTIAKYSDRLVLGWTSEAMTRPALCHYKNIPVPKDCNDEEVARAQQGYYQGPEDKGDDGCLIPPDHPCIPYQLPTGFEKFALKDENVDFGNNFQLRRVPVYSPLTFIANIDSFNQPAQHSAYFSAFPDADNVIRRQVLLKIHGKHLYPALSLEMARIALGEDVHVEFGDDSRVKEIRFTKSGRVIPVNGQASMEMNFRGSEHTFKYISAAEIMHGVDKLQDYGNGRRLAGLSPADVLKDALVLIGVTALGNHDQRDFPFTRDGQGQGVEGHATALDNILAGDMIVEGFHGQATVWLYLFMIFGGMAFAYFTQRLQAVPALLLFLASFAGFSGFDVGYLFSAKNVNWNTGFLYIEMLCIFVFTIAAKYVIEENDKKFVRDAFARYVAPAVVDSIMKDPKKLALGGEKKELTILFSDIRGFTSFSEKMDAKLLSSFLNDYLGIMTDIIFNEQGTLDKYIGDAVMAFWGAPMQQPVHASNACQAAVKMMKALHANKARFKEQYGVDVAIGIGINTGNVSVGNMGSATKFNYTVIGDHVNLASRLEGLTKEYRVPIVTTRFTFEGIAQNGGAAPAHRVLDFVKVKGKKNAVELIQVLDRDLPEAGLETFEEARKLYAQQRWDDAIAKFREAGKALALDGSELDGPSAMYIERCEEFKRNPPAADWDGSWEMHSK